MMTTIEFKDKWLPLSDRFYRVAYYILESGADAEDVVQDLYVKLWNMRDRLDGVKNPVSFGITLVKNMCMDRIRRSGAHTAVSIEDAGLPDTCEAPPPDVEYIGREKLEQLRRIIAQLPERQRKVLQMRIFEGAEYKEIAAATGLSDLNLRVLLSTARKTLRQKMDRL